MYIEDKLTQKPRWTSTALTRLQKAVNAIRQETGSQHEDDLEKLLHEERPSVVCSLASFMPESVKQELKQRMFKQQLLQLQNRKDSLYNTDADFKTMVHRVLEFTCNRHSALNDKVFFACKS